MNCIGHVDSSLHRVCDVSMWNIMLYGWYYIKVSRVCLMNCIGHVDSSLHRVCDVLCGTLCYMGDIRLRCPECV